MSLREITTILGTFRDIGVKDDALEDRWQFKCPGCGEWAYLDEDQWNGRVSVDHAAGGCAGGYHETHDYSRALQEAQHPDSEEQP